MWYGHHPFGAGPYAYAGSLVTISQADEEWLPSIRRRQFAAVTSWMQRVGCRANYTRREAGGARLERRIDGAWGRAIETIADSCQVSLVSPSEAAMATTAERFCPRPCPIATFSPATWQMPRLPGDDSSISARIACRSSLAEITGNSRTSAQPRTHRKTSGGTAELLPRRPRLGEALRCRHKK